MRHDEQVRLIKQLLAHLDTGSNVDAGGLRKNPVDVYTDPELAKREWNEFFLAYPHFLGFGGELPEPGSFFTSDDLGFPLLATRDEQGKFHAFVNSCRHRGAVLEDAERGTSRRFTCAFHSWSYDTEGTLVGLPKADHFGDIDRSCHGLVELPSQEWKGMLFVHPDPDAELDVAEFLGAELADEFESWNFGQLAVLDRDSYEVECNWKLAIDTFGETYHFGALHKDTLYNVFHGNVQCYDTFGLHHRMILTRRAIDDMRHLAEDEWNIAVAGAPVYWLFPNVQILPTNDRCSVVRVYPVQGEPGRHISKITFYLKSGANLEQAIGTRDSDFEKQFEGLELEKVNAAQFGAIIRDEDYVMSASQQRSAESGRLGYSIFGRNEPALHHYHSTYRSVLGMEPLPLLDDSEV